MSLDDVFDRHGTNKGTLTHRYGQWYEWHLLPLPATGTLLEVGVWRGSSLPAWKEWLPGWRIIGMDIDLSSAIIPEGVEVHTADVTLAGQVHACKLPQLDVIVDDASHEATQVAAAVRNLWDYLQPGGWFVIEDLDRDAYEAAIHELYAATGRSWGVSECHIHGQILFARKGK